MKKQKRLSNSSFGKRFLSTVVSMAMAVTLMPALPAVQAEEAAPELLKAGAINATDATVTQEQPFAAGTAGSQNFRIPALITLKNGAHKGNLVAAADARYSTTVDGGGLDTIASVSKDGGKTWQYSFPLYFPDSDGYVGSSATTIIDPGIVEGQDGTIYCFADVNPTGSTTMYKEIGAGTGYVTVGEKRHLALTEDYTKVETMPTDEDTATYPYYVGDFENGYAPILKREDSSATGYGVDEWYNLYSIKDGQYVADLTQKQVNENSATDIQQNVYYQGSKFHVYSIGYIWVITSKDGGLTWEHPRDINDQIKRRTGEKAILVSPGQGITTKSGDIVLGFYDHTNTESHYGENASIVYSTDNGATWKRSNDIPSGTGNDLWTSENEIVELEDGTLRMFTRNGKGCICYADAEKNAAGEYVMGELVQTSVSVTSSCNVTAISYSKKIDGKQAILVGMPAGPNRTNGKICTFLVDPKDNSMTLKNTFAVPNSSSSYQYSCLTELADGTLGLLWENGGGTMRYDNFGIMELVPNAYIEGAEIDVDLWANETYTREYVYPSEYMTGIETSANEEVATATLTRDPEEGTTTTKVLLHPHANTGDNDVSAFNEGFQTEADRNLSVENAEFTITATDEAGIYTVYNESTKQYLCHSSNAGSYFATQKANDMKIVPTAEGADTFYICKDNGERYVAFYLPRFRFDGSGGELPSTEKNKCDLTLLEKQENVADGDDIPGYRKVTSITSGKKYLITCNYEVDGVIKRILLYPTNGQNNQTKLVGEAETTIVPQTSTVTIKGIAEGTTTAVIDGITYNINCKGNPKLNLSKGEKYFIKDGELENCSTEDASKAAVAEDTQMWKALFNCEEEAVNSLSGYADEPNWDINMTVAEFTATKVGDYYTLYNAAEETYLTNQNGTNYFEAIAVTHNLIPVQNSDGTTSFEIRRVSDDGLNNRYVYFYYEKMAFDAVTAKQGTDGRDFTQLGDFGFEFLEKQDVVSNTDPIPGYVQVSEIKDGKNYLITNFYKNDTEEGIIVCYPRTGITNQSKLYRSVAVSGVSIEAKDFGETQVTINGIVYDVIISGCEHEGTGRYIQGRVEATCEEKGYTGDTYCDKCNQKIEDGTETEALGHDWDEGVITTPPTLDADGEKTYTCKHDATHTQKEVVSSLDFAKEQLAAAIADAEAEAEKTDVYTEATLAALNSKLTAANDVKDSTDKAAVVTALNELQAAIDGLVTKEVQAKKDALAEIIAKEVANRDSYTAESLSTLDTAISEAEELLGNADATAAQLQAAYDKVDAALKGLVTKEVQDKKDKLDKIIGTDVGDLNSYTEATRTELNNAIAEANTLLNSGTATAAQLQAAYEKVDAALKGLVTQGKADADKAADTQLSAAEGVLNKKDDYTAESLAEIKKVYDEVQALKNDPKADPAAVTAAVERLKAAIAGLKKKDDTPAPVVIEQGKTYDAGDYYYKVTSTSKMTAEVTGLKNKDVKKLTINSTVKLGGKDYKVTSVAANAFKGNKKVTSITVKKGVTKIGSSAFASCTKVKKAVINSTTLKTIGAKAFSGCKSLKSITIKSKVLKKVGKNTFKGIHKKATIKVPKASLKKYKKLLKKGQAKTVKIK